MSRCVKTDAFEKRNKKGYAFIICDEALPSRCKATSVAKVFNQTIQGDIPIEILVNEVLQKWELFVIVPNMTNHYRSSLQDSWTKVLGQRVIFLEDPEVVVETIATCIGLCEESTDLNDVVKDLKDVGTSADGAAAVTRALAKIGGGSLTKATEGTGLALV